MTPEVADIVKRLKGFSTPELCDGAGIFHAMHHTVKPLWGEGTVVGPAVTVDLPTGESKIVRDVIDSLVPGDVLVIAARGNCESSCWGDYRSRLAALKGAAAVIIDGAARDLKGMKEAGIPVFARGVCCVAGLKSGRGTVNVPISCAGAPVAPGDIIVADENGVIALSAQEAETAMANALAKRAQEENFTY